MAEKLQRHSIARGCRKLVDRFGAKQHRIMDIGEPTNVRHVTHVTFDRFNGFLGLPMEFEPEVSRKPPSASTRVFGVSTDCMQLSFDSRGNCVPTILLMMQKRLYSQGGLQYEGIFRINPENGQEEYVREQLNKGLIPDNVDVHCLAALIKAWFRELPKGILDSVATEQILQTKSEDECSQIVRLLPLTEASLLDWVINLMADVVQFETMNKMNARNIAMVFAPNMTKMLDPLTALMHVVQVMNFLRTLIAKTLRERGESFRDPTSNADSRHRILRARNPGTSSEKMQADQLGNSHGTTGFGMECGNASLGKAKTRSQVWSARNQLSSNSREASRNQATSAAVRAFETAKNNMEIRRINRVQLRGAEAWR